MAPFLAFVDLSVNSLSSPDAVAAALSQLPNAVKLYEVKGEFDVVTLIVRSDIMKTVENS
jgi:DNA-binding Lrp family transcriptional regulator